MMKLHLEVMIYTIRYNLKIKVWNYVQPKATPNLLRDSVQH